MTLKDVVSIVLREYGNHYTLAHAIEDINVFLDEVGNRTKTKQYKDIIVDETHVNDFDLPDTTIGIDAVFWKPLDAEKYIKINSGLTYKGEVQQCLVDCYPTCNIGYDNKLTFIDDLTATDELKVYGRFRNTEVTTNDISQELDLEEKFRTPLVAYLRYYGALASNDAKANYYLSTYRNSFEIALNMSKQEYNNIGCWRRY